MTAQQIVDIVKTACKERNVCKANFVDESSARIINPLGVCLTSKRELLIVCIQSGGYTKSGGLPEFKNLPVDKCTRIEKMKETFKLNKGFNPKSKQYNMWLFHVDEKD
jgi:hypothetical protein